MQYGHLKNEKQISGNIGESNISRLSSKYGKFISAGSKLAGEI